MKKPIKVLPVTKIKRCPHCEKVYWRGKWQALKPEDEVGLYAIKGSPILQKIFLIPGIKIVETEKICESCQRIKDVIPENLPQKDNFNSPFSSLSGFLLGTN